MPHTENPRQMSSTIDNPVRNIINKTTVSLFAFGYKHVIKPCFVL